MADLPEGWAAKTSSSTGRTYYLNEYTKATQWEKPEPVGPGQVTTLKPLNRVERDDCHCMLNINIIPINLLSMGKWEGVC